MQFATVNGVTIHYDTRGRPTGMPLVLVNSLGTDLRLWDEVAPLIDPGFYVIRHDKRGHGLSDCPPGPYTLRDHVADLGGLLDHLGVEAMVLVGVSVGGQIALRFAADAPGRIRALVLCDTGAVIGTRQSWAERIAAVQAQGLGPLSESILARWFGPDFAGRRPALFRGYANMLSRTSPAGYAATCAALSEADLRPVLGTILAPSLVLCGDQDTVTPPAQGEALAAALPRARFAAIPGAGHLPPAEQPQRLAAAINAFWQEVQNE